MAHPRRVAGGAVPALVVLLSGLGLTACSGGDDSAPGGDGASATPSGTSGASPSGSPGAGTTDQATKSPSRGSDPVVKKYRPVKRGAAAPSATVSAPPAAFDQPVRYSDGLRWTVTKITQRKGTEQGVGEFPGEPQTRISLRLRNGSSRAVDLDQVVVTALYGSPRRSARRVYDEGAQDFGGTVKPGRSATALYSFSIPKASLGDVSMYIDFDGRHTPARFTGRAAD